MTELPKPPPDRIFTEEEGPPELDDIRGWDTIRVILAIGAFIPLVGAILVWIY